MNIALIELAARHLEIADEIEASVFEVLRSGRWIGGSVVEEAERMAAKRLGRAHAIGVANGTDALILALWAAGIGPGDEVLVPALSFFATASAVIHAGATPVIVDVSLDGCLDIHAASDARSPTTRAIIPVHLFGSRSKTLPDLITIDDAAQAVGADPPCSIGQLTAISCYPTKTWGASGDAGFVVGDDPQLLENVRRLGNHGLVAPHEHHAVGRFIGRNSRLDAIQAAILIAHDRHTTARVARRRKIAEQYDRYLPSWVSRFPRSLGSPIHHYIVRVPNRAHLQQHLKIHGIETGIYYPRPLGDQPAFAGRVRLTPCPTALEITRECLAIPVHDQLSDEAVERVLAAFHLENP